MILRKPYALFIKYFKFLNAIMSFFIAVLLYNSYRIYNYFRVYSVDYRSTIGNFSSDNYFSFIFYFCIGIVLILTFVLLSVMFYKNKPKDIYIYNFILYILVFVLYFFCNDAIYSTKSVVLSIKLSKALRDLSLIACFFQLISLIITFVRATGFDIKRFDFNSDLQELNISLDDSEEIEVALEFDLNKISAKIRNKIRHLKYFYFEHKYIINVSSLIIIILVFGFVYYRVKLFSASEKIGESFRVGNYTFNVQDSYLVDKDINGNKVSSSGGVFLAVRIQIKGYGKDLILNKGIINLIIDDLTYGVDVDSAKNFSDLGVAYTKQVITDDFSTYFFVFEIASGQADKSIRLKINDYNGYIGGRAGLKNYYVKLKPKDLRKENEFVINKKIGENIDFTESVIGSSSLIIRSYEINNYFKLAYNYCYEKDKCIPSFEYLAPSTTGNYFKTLMKIDGEFKNDKTKNILNLKKMVDFFNNYGVIYYKLGEELKHERINSSIIKPFSAITNDVFIEVPYDVKEANSIYFYFKIRNQNYKYTLK